MADESLYIGCRGVRTHNLKNINLKIPLKKWVAVTGVSGSGKSSLVFDTIYAESQRRFLETLGTYERQFLQGLPQGEFDEIENIPASVALKQSNKTGDPRSVIATAADVADSLRTLFMSLMEDACSQCGHGVKVNYPKELVELILSKENVASNQNFLITVPFLFPKEQTKQKKLCQDLLIEGYIRITVDDQIISLEDSVDDLSLQNTEIILDRLSSKLDKDEIVNRIETIWSQVKFSPRFSSFHVKFLDSKNKVTGKNELFHVQPFCEKCHKKTSIIQSTDLDWQSVLGSCGQCQGLGNIPVLDENKIIPNSQLSLKEGAIKPWTSDTFVWMNEELLRECKKKHIDSLLPYQDLSPEAKNFIWGYADAGAYKKNKQKSFVSITHFFEALEEERYKSSSRILLAKYRKYVTCPSCQGQRIGPVGRNAICFGKTFPELFLCEIKDTLIWLGEIKKQKIYEKKLEAISEIYREVCEKVALLCRLGLGSAHLFRRCKTLSGGEYQRVLLTRVIGNGLTDALYVLDEPSVGLGRNEIPELIHCIRRLRDLGNTVLMVEHDKSLICEADVVFELGPGGGKNGGEILDLKGNMPSSAVISSSKKQYSYLRIPLNENHFKSEESVFLKNFSALNCVEVNLEIAIGCLNVIVGPSGAGKSTLVTYGLQSALEKLEDIGVTSNSDLNLDSSMGIWEKITVPQGFFGKNNLVLVEQKALHRTITSVPATLLGLMDLLRKNFAQVSDAKKDGLTLSDFSFNGEGGCETCGGKGVIEDDLFFLGQVEKVCPDCQGSRYKSQILNYKWKNKNISEWLSTTLAETVILIGKEVGFAKPLTLACQLGLGHLSLGMPTSSMSGGEAQRLRICASLSKSTKKIFCILDEPTRGLSEKDVDQLTDCLLRLTGEGHTFVVVEHHEQFEQFADHLVKMGPGSGVNGGKIIERLIKRG